MYACTHRPGFDRGFKVLEDVARAPENVIGVRFQSMNRSTGSHRSPEKVVGDEGWRTAPHDKMARYHRQHAGQLPGWQTGFRACGHPENPVWRAVRQRDDRGCDKIQCLTLFLKYVTMPPM